MTKKQNINFISLINDVKFSTNMINLNNFELLALFRTYGYTFVNAIGTRGRGYATRLNFLLKFFRFILHLRKMHGVEFCIQYLKTGQLAIQKKLAGTPVSSLRELNPDFPLPRLTNGLPGIIPLSDRRLISSKKSSSVIRYWLSLFSLYRVISCVGKVKLSTITDPFTGDNERLSNIGDQIMSITKHKLAPFLKGLHFSESEIFMISKSSPTYSSSWHGFFGDLLAMNIPLYNSLISFLKSTKQSRLSNYIEGYRELVNELSSKMNIYHGMKDTALELDDSFGEIPMGQLQEKVEPAGKVRIFAMVDFWTQISLKGLHNYLFDILKKLPNDATFDQNESISRVKKKLELYGCSFGYDLSAATDRLPLAIQISVLTVLFSSEMANHWADLLVRNRTYFYKSDQGWEGLKYSVGQPMGALSSWAMLALTHHLLVQMAAQPFKGWFDKYELLGDDIIIFDKRVAERYLEIMEHLGVSINLSKSVISDCKVGEFAKVTILNGVDVSALSWKQFLSSSSSLMGRVNILYFLLNKGIGLNNFNHFTKGLIRKSKYDLGLLAPGYLALLTMLINKKVFTYRWVIAKVNNVKVPLQSWYGTILLSLERTDLYENLYKYFVKGIADSSLSSQRELLMKNKEPWIIIHILKKLVMGQHKWKYSYVQDHTDKSLDVLLNGQDIGALRQDLSNFFWAALDNKSIQVKMGKFLNLNFSKFTSLDEHLEALELLLSIEAHFSAHLQKSKRNVDVESPLRVLSYVTDLAKSVPPFVKDRKVENWFS